MHGERVRWWGWIEREERRIDKNANVRCGPKESEKDEVPAGLAGAFWYLGRAERGTEEFLCI